MTTDWLTSMLRADVQLALLAAAVLVPALLAAAALRGRLPVWRKGLWLGVLLVPVACLVCAQLDAGGPSGPAAQVRAALLGTPLSADPAATRAWAAALGWAYAAWIVGVLLFELAATLHLRRVLRGATDVSDPRVVTLYAYLAKAAGCRRPPRLVLSDRVAAPFVAARAWPGLTVVLPAAFGVTAATARRDALAAVLAHELAHARAGDPWVQRGLFVLKALFPVAWLAVLAAARVLWEDAAEETTDLRAVRAAGLTPAAYGAVLKDFALADDGAPGSARGLALGSPRPRPTATSRRPPASSPTGWGGA